MQRRHLLQVAGAACAIAVLPVARNTRAQAASKPDPAKRQAISAEVDETLPKLYASVHGSEELVARAKGTLVFPVMMQAGFIAGARYGQGALLIDGKTAGYYSAVSGANGLNGADRQTMLVMLMTNEKLDALRREEDWAVGKDPSAVLVRADKDGQIHAASADAPVQMLLMTRSALWSDAELSRISVRRLAI